MDSEEYYRVRSQEKTVGESHIQWQEVVRTTGGGFPEMEDSEAEHLESRRRQKHWRSEVCRIWIFGGKSTDLDTVYIGTLEDTW